MNDDPYIERNDEDRAFLAAVEGDARGIWEWPSNETSYLHARDELLASGMPLGRVTELLCDLFSAGRAEAFEKYGDD